MKVKKKGVKNGLETAYYKLLQDDPRVVSALYEPTKLILYKKRLSNGRTRKRWYTPDFEVVYTDGRREFHECKARHRFAREGLLKLCFAAAMFPNLSFVLVEKKRGKWTTEEY